ncbi:RidA family protein [Halieaceae bacterium]|nr:RidA family protein [Halieaceae bacterium]
MTIEHINPEGLFKLDGFTQVVSASGSKTIYIAGQGAFDKDFNLMGAGDHFAQTTQAFKNLKIALEAAGATPADVVSSTMYVVGMNEKSVGEFTSAMAKALDGQPFPPNASSMIGVESLAMAGMLVEISAIAVKD